MWRVSTELVCDRCGNFGGTIWSDRVQKARAWAKIVQNRAWEKRLHRGRWEHYCPSCAHYLKRGSLWQVPYVYVPEPDCYMPW